MYLFLLLTLFNYFGEAAPRCPGLFEKITGEAPLDRLDRAILKELEQNYFFLDRSDQSAVHKWNQNLVSALRASPIPSSTTQKTTLTDQEIRILYRTLENHPVASCKHLPKYDPQGNIGFCFGRAAAAHLLALHQGLHKESVRKIWAVGTMYANDVTWGHHVATMVRGADKKWYVLDPEYKKVLPLENWMREVKKMDGDGKLIFVSSDAKRFGPVSSDTYQAIELKDDFYNQYFEDLLEDIRKRSKEKKGENLGPQERD